MNDIKATLYTMRWSATKIKALTDDIKISNLADDLIEMSSQLLNEPIPEETRPPEPPRPDVDPKPIEIKPVPATKSL